MKSKQTYLMAGLIVSLVGCTENIKTSVEKENELAQEPIVHTATADQATVKERKKSVAGQRAESIQPMAMYGMVAEKSMALSSSPAAIIAPSPRPDWNQESYDNRVENGFINCANDSVSTFSIDVDTASYANIRRFINNGNLPPVGAIRTEEIINYFTYDYPAPNSNKPVNIITETGPSPFNKGYRIVRIGIKARDIDAANLPPSNLVFLVDVSGSMNNPNKLGLLKRSMKLAVDKLSARDRVSIVTYAGANRVALEPTPGNNKKEIYAAIDAMRSGGSTNGSGGIQTAYKLAQQVIMPGGNNRIILASDGDFNVGITSRGELQKLIEEKRKSGIYLTVLGFGMTNYHDDTMEVLAHKGNGNYAYIDSLLEANKVMVKEMGGTFFTVANDVKIQVEFNPNKVGGYRLIGYENRLLQDEDFKDDSKDAGEMGAGHTVTALYEIIPAGHSNIPTVDKLRYQKTDFVDSDELLTVKVRYKDSLSSASKELNRSVKAVERSMVQTSEEYKFAVAAAGFGMMLIKSEYNKDMGWQECLTLAKSGKGKDENGYRGEFIRLIELAELMDNVR